MVKQEENYITHHEDIFIMSLSLKLKTDVSAFPPSATAPLPKVFLLSGRHSGDFLNCFFTAIMCIDNI